jgi:hypothetical protein
MRSGPVRQDKEFLKLKRRTPAAVFLAKRREGSEIGNLKG